MYNIVISIFFVAILFTLFFHIIRKKVYKHKARIIFDSASALSRQIAEESIEQQLLLPEIAEEMDMPLGIPAPALPLPAIEETYIISKDIMVLYHNVMYVGADYEIKIQFVGRGEATSFVKEENKETIERRESIQIVSSTKTPEIEISISAPAFYLDEKKRKIKISDDKPSPVMTFILRPRENTEGKRKIKISLHCEDILVTEIVLDVNIVSYIVDHIKLKYARIAEILGTILSIATGTITFMLSIFP